MNIGIYSPYWQTASGGERYLLTLASHLTDRHTVSLFSNDISIIDHLSHRLNIDASKIFVVPDSFQSKNRLKRIWATRPYDCIIFLTDGSIPTSFARHNILHIQVPFPKISRNPLKLARYDAVVCNSEFTKLHLDPVLGKRAVVIYPPVDTKGFAPRKKEKLIVSIGRFTHVHTAKKQEVLIDVFRSLVDQKKLSGWHLVLAGGMLPEEHEYVEKLKYLARNYQISIIPNISQKELVSWYGKATFYWHAAGFGETDPIRMEHFGISVVEAMASGAIPLVFAGGGLSEIVTTGYNGILWTTSAELIDQTVALMKHSAKMKEFSKNAVLRSRNFDVRVFTNAYDELLQKIFV